MIDESDPVVWRQRIGMLNWPLNVSGKEGPIYCLGCSYGRCNMRPTIGLVSLWILSTSDAERQPVRTALIPSLAVPDSAGCKKR